MKTSANFPLEPVDSGKLSSSFLWGLLLLFLALWLYALGMRTLVPTDEGRYAEMAREMLLSGDWITPRLNGIKYFEKPPLQTWMNAATFAMFGLGEWQARLWTGLSSLIGIALVGYTGHRLYDTHTDTHPNTRTDARTSVYAMLVLASSFMWFGLGHINTLDMGLSGMMTLALCALLLAQHDQASASEQRNWMLACWAGMALAVLSKGLIGVVLPGAVLVLYTVASRDWRIWQRLHLLAGLLLFFAICTPWFVLVSLKNPEFPHFFFIHEHVDRFLTKVHKRAGPWYYFLPLLALGITPWLAALPPSLIKACQRQPQQQFQAQWMLLIWAGFIFFFFSYSGSKLPSYILPIFPALALLIARQLVQDPRKGLVGSIAVLLVLGAGGVWLALNMARFSFDPLETPYLQAYQPWMLAASGLAMAGALLTLYWLWRKRPTFCVVTLASCALLAWVLILQATEAHGRYRAGLSLLPALTRELTPATRLYAVGMYDQTLPFYLRRTVTLVEHMDELEFGLKQQPELWIEDQDDFIAEWNKNTPAIAIMSPEKFDELQELEEPPQPLRLRVLARDSRRVVVSNQSGNQIANPQQADQRIAPHTAPQSGAPVAPSLPKEKP
jgi:4-amino-4-deoxy-L-arabinose transferase-like glycosyltransferase